MSNDFFNPSGTPSQGSGVNSPPIRAELLAIGQAFDKLAPLGGNADKVVVVNSSASGYTVTTMPAIVAAAFAGYTVKSPPVDADRFVIMDSADANNAKYVLWSAIKSTLKTYFDTLYTTSSAVASYVSGLIGSTIQAYNATLAALAAGTTTGLGAISGIGNGRATDITISSAGEVTMPLQPAFLAYNSATDSNVTGDNTAYTVVFDTEVFDQNGDYNNATGVFTAPVTGRYRLTARVLTQSMAAAHTAHNFYIRTSNRDYSFQDTFTSSPFIGGRQFEINALCDMDAGDTAYVIVAIQGSTKVVGVYGNASSNYTMFSGELVA